MRNLLVSTQGLKLPSMKTTASYSSRTSISFLEIWEVFFPLPLANPMTTEMEPPSLMTSAISQMGWGMWCLPRVHPTTAISVPASGTLLRSPPISLDIASRTPWSSSGMDMVTVSIWALRIWCSTVPPTSSIAS